MQAPKWSTRLMLVLSWMQGGLKRGTVVTMRMASLITKDRITVGAVTVLRGGGLDGFKAPTDEAKGHCSDTSTSTAPSSQMDDIRSMLQGCVLEASGPGGDPKKSLMAAVARSALQKGAAGSAGLQPAAFSAPVPGHQGSASPDLEKILARVESQGAELEKLTRAVDGLQQLCLEILQQVKSHNDLQSAVQRHG